MFNGELDGKMIRTMKYSFIGFNDQQMSTEKKKILAYRQLLSRVPAGGQLGAPTRRPIVPIRNSCGQRPTLRSL